MITCLEVDGNLVDPIALWIWLKVEQQRSDYCGTMLIELVLMLPERALDGNQTYRCFQYIAERSVVVHDRKNPGPSKEQETQKDTKIMMFIVHICFFNSFCCYILPMVRQASGPLNRCLLCWWIINIKNQWEVCPKRPLNEPRIFKNGQEKVCNQAKRIEKKSWSRETRSVYCQQQGQRSY